MLESSSKPILVSELMYADDYLTAKCEILRVDRFDLVLTFLENDVIAKDESNYLYVQLSNHLMDMNTYREADICGRSVSGDRPRRKRRKKLYRPCRNRQTFPAGISGNRSRRPREESLLPPRRRLGRPERQTVRIPHHL